MTNQAKQVNNAEDDNKRVTKITRNGKEISIVVKNKAKRRGLKGVKSDKAFSQLDQATRSQYLSYQLNNWKKNYRAGSNTGGAEVVGMSTKFELE